MAKPAPLKTTVAAILAALLAAPGSAVCAPLKEASAPAADARVAPISLSVPQAGALTAPQAADALAASPEALALPQAAVAAGAAAAASTETPGAAGKQGAAEVSASAGDQSEGSAAQGAAEFDGSEAARAAALRESQVAAVRASSHELGLFPRRLPFSLGDYFVHWTRRSKDVQRLGRQTMVRPAVEFWAAATPAPFNRYWRKMKAMLDFIDRVESKPPEWTTPHRVLVDAPSFRLLDFTGSARAPLDRAKAPVLIVPPNSGHLSTIADYDDGKSLVQTSLGQGRATYAIEWKSATPDNPQLISDMVADVTRAMERIGGQVVLKGLCQGGWVSLIANAVHPEKVAALMLAGSPIDATRGDNDITRVSAGMPIEFFRWLVQGIGLENVQDGENQLEGFLSLGPDGGRAKRVDFWTDLFHNVEDPAYVERAERFARWFYHVNHLSLWYLEAIEKIFKGNELYKGTLKVQVGAELKTVDLSRIKNPIVMLEGTKDDITPPASVGKEELRGVVSDVEGAWRFLNREGLIADTGEELVNRKPGERAVIEPKLFETSFRAFAKLDRLATRPLYDFLLSRQGQSFAAENVVGTPKRDLYKRTLNVGHIGLYNSGKAQEAWAKALKWLDRRAGR